MIIDNLLLWLEVSSLALLVGLGAWHIYRIRQPATINASAPVTHDMRQDGQLANTPAAAAVTV